jgi:hypothetical protein
MGATPPYEFSLVLIADDFKLKCVCTIKRSSLRSILLERNSTEKLNVGPALSMKQHLHSDICDDL